MTQQQLDHVNNYMYYLREGDLRVEHCSSYNGMKGVRNKYDYRTLKEAGNLFENQELAEDVSLKMRACLLREGNRICPEPSCTHSRIQLSSFLPHLACALLQCLSAYVLLHIHRHRR